VFYDIGMTNHQYIVIKITGMIKIILVGIVGIFIILYPEPEQKLFYRFPFVEI